MRQKYDRQCMAKDEGAEDESDAIRCELPAGDGRFHIAGGRALKLGQAGHYSFEGEAWSDEETAVYDKALPDAYGEMSPEMQILMSVDRPPFDWEVSQW